MRFGWTVKSSRGVSSGVELFSCLLLAAALSLPLHADLSLLPTRACAKGRGREFEEWRRLNAKSTTYIPFERAVGSRQDLRFDGCVPLFVNRITCLEFLRGYIDCPKSENVLDKSLYTLLRCNEFTALLRANSLWKILFSEPFRWLSGKSAKLEGWSLYKMSWVLDLIEKAME